MTFAIIILFLSLALAFGMIGRKLWQLKTGRVAYDVTYESENWTEISVEEMRNELAELTKYAIHHGILFALKMWIVLSNKIRLFDRKIREKLTHLLHKNGHLPSGNPASPFLRRISEHKQSVMSESTRVNEGKPAVENNPEMK